MNQTPKVPPRFVPTLTEVVPVEQAEPVEGTGDIAKTSSGLDQALAEVERSLSPQEAAEQLVPSAAPLASFHSPWLADGLYARGKPVTIPQELPPLPASLPPQQPFADVSVHLDESVPMQTTEPDEAQPSVRAAEPEPAAESPVLLSAEEVEADSEMAQLGADAGEQSATVDESLAVPSTAEHAEQSFAIDEEQLVIRLMAEIDPLLEQRVQEAVDAVVQEQAQLLVSRLRESVQAAVRASVQQAVEAAASQMSDSNLKR